MSLSQRLSPITARLAHILTVNRTQASLEARSSVGDTPLAIYYGGPLGDIYQVTQWTPVFEELDDRLKSVILVKDAQVARELATRCALPIRIAGNADSIEPLISKHGIKALFYVNNNLANFSPLRIASTRHIHLSHGESEKVSMISNQLKAYDYCFIAGEASASRITAALSNFDPSHLKQIGRPQLDKLTMSIPFEHHSDRSVVLYAPTWEGDRAAMKYSSVASVGELWVKQILADERFQLIYRPHPKTGERCKSTRDANARIKKLIAAADISAGHQVDRRSDPNRSLVSADVGIFDVSAMAMDYSVLQRPLFVSHPNGSSSDQVSPLWNAARKAEMAPEFDVIKELSQALEQGPLPSAPRFVFDHFGDTSQGHATQSFTNTTLTVI